MKKLFLRSFLNLLNISYISKTGLNILLKMYFWSASIKSSTSKPLFHLLSFENKKNDVLCSSVLPNTTKQGYKQETITIHRVHLPFLVSENTVLKIVLDFRGGWHTAAQCNPWARVVCHEIVCSFHILVDFVVPPEYWPCSFVS